MGKVCTTCGIDIDDPKLPDDEPEQCDDCAEGSDNPEMSDDFSDDWD
jgi:hypothetical protein